MGHYEYLQGTGVNMETYKISQIARLLGLSSDTIRFYEKKRTGASCYKSG